MITVSLTKLTTDQLYNNVRDVHSKLKESLLGLGVPVLDLYTDFEISEETSKLFFEYFSEFCDHFGSSSAFYSSFLVLNNFVTTVEFFNQNRIDFNNLNLRSEHIIVLNSFKIFK